MVVVAVAVALIVAVVVMMWVVVMVVAVAVVVVVGTVMTMVQELRMSHSSIRRVHRPCARLQTSGTVAGAPAHAKQDTSWRLAHLSFVQQALDLSQVNLVRRIFIAPATRTHATDSMRVTAQVRTRAGPRRR